MSTTCRPSKRAGFAGLVMAPYGGRAIGCIFANGSFFMLAESRAGALSASDHTAKRPSRGTEPAGYFSSCSASPPGWSMRIAHVFPLAPPVRVEVKNRNRPSGDQRGDVLSWLGDVNRFGSPPAVGTTQISLWRLFSASRTVVKVKATRSPEGDMAGALSVVSLYQSASWKARGAAACCAASGAAASSPSAAREREVNIGGWGKWGERGAGARTVPLYTHEWVGSVAANP